MRTRATTIGLLVVLLFLLSSCSRDQSTTPAAPTWSATPDATPIATSIMEISEWEYESGTRPDLAEKQRCGIFEFGREELTGNIAHYWWTIPFGDGPHDRIRLHRVVKERHAYRPIRARKNLFALHGTPGHFEVMFLFGSQTSAPDDQSLAVFLADQDVDVWGIDQAYTLIPADETDFSSMADWGLQFDVDNLRLGMGVARLLRWFTGSGRGKMTLLGYSTGMVTGFAALNDETQLHRRARHIGAFIPVDNYYLTQEPEWNEADCANLELNAELLDAGIYALDYGVLFQTMGNLALSDPDGISPIVPDFNNMQMALFAGAMTGALFGFPGDLHFLGGVFEEGMPVDLAYTPTVQYLEWLQGFNNFNATRFDYDISSLYCPDVDSPFDDHLHLIDVPVLFVGAGGGWGNMMDYTASLLTGADDVSVHTVSLNSEMLLDIGHVDIFTAECAALEFWTPMYQWLVDHHHANEADGEVEQQAEVAVQ